MHKGSLSAWLGEVSGIPFRDPGGPGRSGWSGPGACRDRTDLMVLDRARIDNESVLIRPRLNRTPVSSAPSVTPVAAKNTSSPPTSWRVVRIASRS